MTARMWRALMVLSIVAVVAAIVNGGSVFDDDEGVAHALALLFICAIGEQTARRP